MSKPYGPDAPEHAHISVTINRQELETIIERASETAAKKALASVGLHDETAANDVRDLRNLLTSWRDAKVEVRRTAVRFVTTIVLGAMAAAMTAKWLIGGGTPPR